MKIIDFFQSASNGQAWSLRPVERSGVFCLDVQTGSAVPAGTTLQFTIDDVDGFGVNGTTTVDLVDRIPQRFYFKGKAPSRGSYQIGAGSAGITIALYRMEEDT
jgi:hypothetical protein